MLFQRAPPVYKSAVPGTPGPSIGRNCSNSREGLPPCASLTTVARRSSLDASICPPLVPLPQELKAVRDSSPAASWAVCHGDRDLASGSPSRWPVPEILTPRGLC